ncbi:MAG: hypothetical protein AAF669_06550 [Pseudomonadota bacterium]
MKSLLVKKPFLLVLSIFITGAVAIIIVSCLPFIPSWEKTQNIITIVLSIIFFSILLVITSKSWLACHSKIVLTMNLILSCFFIIIIWLVLISSSVGWLNEKTLNRKLIDYRTGNTIYIFSNSRIPDGFFLTSIYSRNTFLPFKWNILKIKKEFKYAQYINGYLHLVFDETYRLTYINGKLIENKLQNATLTP